MIVPPEAIINLSLSLLAVFKLASNLTPAPSLSVTVFVPLAKSVYAPSITSITPLVFTVAVDVPFNVVAKIPNSPPLTLTV